MDNQQLLVLISMGFLFTAIGILTKSKKPNKNFEESSKKIDYLKFGLKLHWYSFSQNTFYMGIFFIILALVLFVKELIFKV